MRQINQKEDRIMNNSFGQTLDKINRRSPTDGTGGIRRTPTDGTGGIR